MVLVIVLLEIVGVVGRQQRDPEVDVHLDQLGVHPILVADAVALHLQVVAVAEDLVELRDLLPGRLHLAVADGAANHRREATRRRDQALAVLAQEVHVDARLVVEALEVAA